MARVVGRNNTAPVVVMARVVDCTAKDALRRRRSNGERRVDGGGGVGGGAAPVLSDIDRCGGVGAGGAAGTVQLSWW